MKDNFIGYGCTHSTAQLWSLRTTFRSAFSPSTIWVPRTNSRYPAQGQAPLSSEPSPWPRTSYGSPYCAHVLKCLEKLLLLQETSQTQKQSAPHTAVCRIALKTMQEAGWLFLQGTEHGVAALTQQTLVGPGGTGGWQSSNYICSRGLPWPSSVIPLSHSCGLTLSKRHGPPLLSSPLVPARRPCYFRPAYHVIFPSSPIQVQERSSRMS